MRSYDFAPFAAKTQQGTWVGINHEYANALMQVVGCSYTIIEAPWARGIDMLKNGEVDFMAQVSLTEARKKDFYYVGPQRMETIVLVTRRNRYETISTWRQLQRLDAVLLRQKGSYYGSKFEQVLAHNPKLRHQMVDLPNSEVRLTLLEKGRIDGFLIDKIYLNYLMKTHQSAELLQMNPLVIHQNPVYFAFSKASVDDKLIAKIRQAYAQLGPNGKLEAITRRYEQDDPHPLAHIKSEAKVAQQ